MTSFPSLDYFADNWKAHSKENIESLGEAWWIASKMVELHERALRVPTDYDGMTKANAEAITLLSTHGLNLFISCMSLTARGQFNVVVYLLRAIADCQLLLMATGCSDQLAEDFLGGKLKGSDARKFQVELVKLSDPELADFINMRLDIELNKAANNLAHVNISTVAKVLDSEREPRPPMIGGRNNAKEAKEVVSGLLEHEQWQLAWLKFFKQPSLGDEWKSEARQNRKRLLDWMESTFGPGQLADRLPSVLRRTES
jgi:hypothetical protein